jgi:MYXO-CTERM domain-containing protein
MRRAACLALALALAAACGADDARVAARHDQVSAGRDVDLPLPAASRFYATPTGYRALGDGYRASVDERGAISVASSRAGTRPLELRTQSIVRGRALYGALGDERAASLQKGRLDFARGPVTEHLVASPHALEQSWTFDALPPGAGELAVRVHSSTPLHAEGDRLVTSARLSYRDAAWVDSRGQRTALRLALEGNDIVIRVPADVVERASYPATLDPTIGPELSVDAPVVGVPNTGAYYPQIAAGKSGNALVVWGDGRVEAPLNNGLFSGSHLLGARVTPAGTILDPTGFVIGGERDFYYQDWKVTYDGTKNWFVTWTQSGLNSPCEELWAAVVDDLGKLVSSKVAQGACSARSVSAGFDGTNLIVAFDLYGAGNDLYATRFSPAGVPLDPLPKPVATGKQSYSRHGLACKTGQCLAAWATPSGARATRIGPGVTVLDATPIVVSNSLGEVSGVVYDGLSYVVSVGTQLVRIDPATGALVGSAVTVGADAIASIATDGATTWAVWANASLQIGAGRMTQAGALVPGGPLALTTGATAASPVVALGGGNAIIAWEDERLHASRDIFMGRASSAGAALDGDGVPFEKAANGEVFPSVATNGAGYLVSWSDYRNVPDNRGTYAARLALDGTPLDAAATLIEPQAYSSSTASNGTDYLVVTDVAASQFNTGAVRAVRISGATGGVLGPALDLTSAGLLPAVAHDGTQYVVAWVESGVRAARLSNAGALVGAPLVLSTDTGVFGEGTRLGAASGNGVTLVIFNNHTGVYGVRIDSTGQILDTTPILIGGGIANCFYPSVTWDGVQWVVVWEDYRAAHITDPKVFAARVSPAGVVVAPKEFKVNAGPSAQVFPAVIGMNDGYSDLVVWSDNGNPDRYQDFALKGAWFRRSDGSSLDPTGVVLSDRLGNEIGAALAPAGAGRAILAYHVTDFTSGLGNTRVRVRFIGSGKSAATACTKDDDCITRACSDGVCCDRACKGTCETCTATPGTCKPVVLAEDPDTCKGQDACTAASVCKRKQGQGCLIDGDCGSGFCAAGICCDRRCDAACETCPAATGVCTLRPARSAGAPTCAPYACDGTNASCPATCKDNGSCPAGSRCELSSGFCVAGATCLDARTALLDDQSTVDCSPYTCGGGSCRTSCRNVGDCVYPSVCDEGGLCVFAGAGPAADSGCSASSGQPSSGGGWLVVVAAFALGRRRRRAS